MHARLAFNRGTSPPTPRTMSPPDNGSNGPNDPSRAVRYRPHPKWSCSEDSDRAAKRIVITPGLPAKKAQPGAVVRSDSPPFDDSTTAAKPFVWTHRGSRWLIDSALHTPFK